MRRRDGLAGLGAFAIGPLAPAQQPAPRRIGLLITGARPAQGESLAVNNIVAALRDAGLEAGPRLRIEVRYGGGSEATLAVAAAELVALPVDVIVASFTPAAVAARRATDSIPIVMHSVADPLSSGLVTSLSRPGGNVTGHGGFGAELALKNLELLREWWPGARQVAVLSQAGDPWSPLLLAEVERTAQRLHLQPRVQQVSDPAQYDAVFAAWSRDKVDALLVQPSTSFAHALPLVRRHRLPSCSLVRDWAERGGLFAYTVVAGEIPAIVAGYVRRILGGQSPASLPVHQGSRFGLYLNAAAARGLGLEIPSTIRLRAVEVIE